jgi:hypothetical protein
MVGTSVGQTWALSGSGAVFLGGGDGPSLVSAH